MCATSAKVRTAEVLPVASAGLTYGPTGAVIGEWVRASVSLPRRLCCSNMSFSPVKPGALVSFGGTSVSPRVGRGDAGGYRSSNERSWPSREYRPHWGEGRDHVRAITFRLCDALPSGRSGWRSGRPQEGAGTGVAPLARVPDTRQAIDQMLDAGGGCCWLARPEIAELVESTLLHFDPGRYRLLAWCVMPNHVHALVEIRPGITMDSIVRAWKSYTAIRANKLLGRNGNFWQRNHQAQPVLHAARCQEIIDQIETNPSRAGLVQRCTDWHWSSARMRPAGTSKPASVH